MGKKPEAVGSGNAGATEPSEGVVRGGRSQETIGGMSIQESLQLHLSPTKSKIEA